MVKLTSNAECPGKLSVERHCDMCTVQMKAGCIKARKTKKMEETVCKSEKLLCKAPLLRPGKKDVASAGAVVRACGEAHGPRQLRVGD
jgi:hypothetical protein